MYPGTYAEQHPDRAAFIMASTGEVVTYREFEARSNQLAHLLRAHGLGLLDHYSVFMENNDRYMEACAAGERAGLYWTPVNSYLTAEELAYIVNNSGSTVLITSRAKREIVLAALPDCPSLSLVLVVDEPGGSGDDRVRDYATAICTFSTTRCSRSRRVSRAPSGSPQRPRSAITTIRRRPPRPLRPMER